MNSKIKSQQLKNSLEALDSTPVDIKGPKLHLIIVNTPYGRMQIKSHLTGPEWVKDQQMKLKSKPKKKKRK